MPNSQSEKIQLLLAACAGSIVGITILTAFNSFQRSTRRARLKDEVAPSVEGNVAGSFTTRPSKILDPPKEPYDDVLTREQLARNYAFFGDEGMAKIRASKVAVVGCGGVGSIAAVMLARSGVSYIRLIDFDYVTLSSLNRHATATLEDVGTAKVKSIERFLNKICRFAEIEARVELWQKETGGALLAGVDWVIDAIDNIDTKVDLLKYCHDNHIKVFSSMGAGAKSDPTRIQISDISYTIYDPLARSVRRRLRLQGVSGGIPVVYSTEVPSDIKLLPLPEEEFQKGQVHELGVLDSFRVRILPVIGPLPSLFGLYATTYVLCELAGKPIQNPLAIKNRRKVYERLLRDLLHRESTLTGHMINKLPLDEDDVSFIFEDLYRARSVIPPHDVPSKPVLVRWDLASPLSLTNCVVMDEVQAKKHLQSYAEQGKHWSPSTIWGDKAQSIVDKRSTEVARYQQYINV